MGTDFTPGPWGLEEDGGDWFITYDLHLEHGPRRLGVVFDYANEFESANARLIVKAPDMARLIADIEESLTADGTYRLLREACQKMLREIGTQVTA